MAEKSKTTRRYKRKILALSRQVESLEAKVIISDARLVKANHQITEMEDMASEGLLPEVVK